MQDKSLGAELVSAVKEALNAKENGRVVRSKFDVVAIRERLNLTQKQFSEQYHINLETLRNWEQGKREPDTTSLAYLTCIAQRPMMIKKLLKAI